MAKVAEQIDTFPATTAEIMDSAAFRRGLDDVRNGIPFDWRIGDWDYERGRLFAYLAPLSMSLRINGKLNPKAIALCEAAFNRRFLI
jgi:hypothetical protein